MAGAGAVAVAGAAAALGRTTRCVLSSVCLSQTSNHRRLIAVTQGHLQAKQSDYMSLPVNTINMILINLRRN